MAMDLPMSGARREGRAGLLVLAWLALASACSLGSPSSPIATAANKDAGSAASTPQWEIVVHPISDMYQAVWLDGSDTIYAIGYNIYGDYGTGYSVTSSHDDGKTWTTVPLINQPSQLVSIAAVGATDVYAVGLSYDYADPDNSSALVAKSTDRGATFTLLNPSFAGGFNRVAADSAGNPIAVGNASDGGFFVRSTDGGATWSRVPVPGTEMLWGLWTTASGLIYACGQGASPVAPLDGGIDGGGIDGGGIDGGPGGVVGGTAARPTGVVVRSDDGGTTWFTLATAPAPLFAISGTADGQRMVAVGAGFTEMESTDAGASWFVHCSDAGTTSRYSSFASVWVPDAHSAPFIAAGNAPYVVKDASCADAYAPMLEGYEELPDAGPGLQSGAAAVAGRSSMDVWAVGAGIFRRR